MDQRGSKMDHNGPKWTKTYQNRPKRTKMDQTYQDWQLCDKSNNWYDPWLEMLWILAISLMKIFLDQRETSVMDQLGPNKDKKLKRVDQSRTKQELQNSLKFTNFKKVCFTSSVSLTFYTIILSPSLTVLYRRKPCPSWFSSRTKIKIVPSKLL